MFKKYRFYETSLVQHTIALEHCCEVLYLRENAKRCKDVILRPPQLHSIVLPLGFFIKSPWTFKAIGNRMLVEHASGYSISVILRSSKV